MSVIDELKALSKKYDMRPDHFHKDPRGFVIMTRRGVEHVQAKIKAVVTFETVPEWSDPSEGRYCVKAHAKCEIGQVEAVDVFREDLLASFCKFYYFDQQLRNIIRYQR